MLRIILLIFFLPLIAIYSQVINPNSELNYYPLEIGNYFEFKSYHFNTPLPTDSSAYSVSIIGDTTLENGKSYKKLLIKEILDGEYSYYNYERIDSSNSSVYRYKNDGNFTNDEFKIDSLFAKPGDVISCSRQGFSSFGYFRTLCLSSRTDTILGFPTQIKEFEDQSAIPLLNYELAQGLGFVSNWACEFGCTSTHLKYAEIDGITYGRKITSVDLTNNNISLNYKLYQNFPNPFNPITKIKFTIPVGNDNVRSLLKIYDVLGNDVTTLVDDVKPHGTYEVEFDGSNLSSGVYFYQLISQNFSETKKLLLLK